MFIILPLGHSVSLRRLPWVTLVIAMLCIIIQAQACNNSAAIQKNDLDDRIAPIVEQIRAETVGSPIRAEIQNLQNEYSSEEIAIQLEEAHPGDPLYQDLAFEFRMLDIGSTKPTWNVTLGYTPNKMSLWKMLTSSFAHENSFPLIINLIFLYFVGSRLEDRWGKAPFALIYAMGAIVAATTFAILTKNPGSILMDSSGAVSAAVGAFALVYSSTRITFGYAYIFPLPYCYRFGVGYFPAPAILLVLIWGCKIMVFNMFVERIGLTQGSNYPSDIASFAFGFVAALVIQNSGLDRKLKRKAAATKESFAEDPGFVEALKLKNAGQYQQAFDGFAEVLKQEPTHDGAVQQHLIIAAQLGHQQLAHDRLAATISSLIAQRKSNEAFELVNNIRDHAPTFQLNGREYMLLIKAASVIQAHEKVVYITQEFLRAHPGDEQVPSAVWASAKAQKALGELAVYQRTLHKLAVAFPHTPFGQRAQSELSQISNPTSPAGY